MKNTPAQQAIAILIDLAEKGEINPWDVQVIEVIDRFLTELVVEVPESAPGYTEINLSRSGQAFLWASMLILLKANTLAKLGEIEENEEEIISENLIEPEENGSHLPTRLELHLRRRAGAPPVRKRRVTLQELIQQIEEIATQIEDKPPQKKTIRLQSRRETAKIISQLAHQENLTEVASFLDQFLSRQLPTLIPEKTDLNLDELISLLSEHLATQKTQPMGLETHAFNRVGVFWALLLLSSQSKVELSQQEFYQEIKIRSISEAIHKIA